MVYDSDYREGNIADDSVFSPLDQQGADSPGGFDVPATANKITEIIISMAPDFTADTIFGWASGVHLFGAGLKSMGSGYFGGPTASLGAGTNVSPTSGTGSVQRYLTNIPVNPGAKINAEGEFFGADIGELHIALQLVYDGPVVGKIRDADYRMGAGAAANTLVNMGIRGATTEGDFRIAYPQIGEIHFGSGILGVAGPLRFLPALHLSGNAFKFAGNYKFLGKSGGTQDDIAAFGALSIESLERFICGIPVKVGNTLRAQVQMIEDDAGTANANCTICYY